MRAPASPLAAAFEHAERLAQGSRVAQLTAAPLDVDYHHGDTDGSFLENVASIRRVLNDAYRANGSKVKEDYDGDRLLERLNALGDEHENLGDDMCQVLTHHQESAYVYGLAVGLLLAKGRAVR